MRRRLRLRTPAGIVRCSTRLPGAHNAANTAAAFAVGHSLGLPAIEIANALVDVAAPPDAGRSSPNRSRSTWSSTTDIPDGIRQALTTARGVVDAREDAALRTVFGAVGLRDREKARESGRVAGELSDHLILTTGSAPRGPRVVRLAELRRAASGSGVEVETVLERRAAIERAIARAQPGDVVVVLGLGALQRIVLDAAGTVQANDDRETVREILGRARVPA